MAAKPSIDIRGTLLKLFPASQIRALARETGAVVRMRKVDPFDLFWTIVLGFGVDGARSFNTLRRRYQQTTGERLEESSFQERFNTGLARMFKQLADNALQWSLSGGPQLRGALGRFRDVLVTDATVVRLHDLLEKAFPACRTNHTRAAAKLHVVMNLQGAGRQSVRLTSERAHENKVMQIGSWVKDRLMLFDLGFYDFHLFARIHQNGGFFVSRLKRNANLTITDVHRTHRGRAADLVGHSLQEVLPKLQREVLDVQVEAPYKKRAYRGRRRKATRSLRLVGVRDTDSGEYHLYLTNVPVDRLAAEDIQTTYALRWQVELLFKELKSHYRLDEMPSQRKEVVETLLYAAILSLTVSRRLLIAVRDALSNQADRLKEHRFAALLGSLAGDLLAVVLWPAREVRSLHHRLSGILLHEALDPNKGRASLVQAVDQRALPMSFAP